MVRRDPRSKLRWFRHVSGAGICGVSDTKPTYVDGLSITHSGRVLLPL